MNGVLCVNQARDEVHVAGQAVELRDDNRRLELPGGGQSSRELRPAIERVSALACLDLAEGLGQVVALDLGEASERRDLSFKAKTRAALLRGRDPGVDDGDFHDLDPPQITPQCRLLCDAEEGLKVPLSFLFRFRMGFAVASASRSEAFSIYGSATVGGLKSFRKRLAFGRASPCRSYPCVRRRAGREKRRPPSSLRRSSPIRAKASPSSTPIRTRP